MKLLEWVRRKWKITFSPSLRFGTFRFGDDRYEV